MWFYCKHDKQCLILKKSNKNNHTSQTLIIFLQPCHKMFTHHKKGFSLMKVFLFEPASGIMMHNHNTEKEVYFNDLLESLQVQRSVCGQFAHKFIKIILKAYSTKLKRHKTDMQHIRNSTTHSCTQAMVSCCLYSEGAVASVSAPYLCLL